MADEDVRKVLLAGVSKGDEVALGCPDGTDGEVALGLLDAEWRCCVWGVRNAYCCFGQALLVVESCVGGTEQRGVDG